MLTILNKLFVVKPTHVFYNLIINVKGYLIKREGGKMKYIFPDKNELPEINELPDPFLKADKSRIALKEEWPAQREYLKDMLAHYLYGHMPQENGVTKGEVIFSRQVYGGKAVAETIRITTGRKEEICFTVDVIRPLKEQKVPVFTWNQQAGRHGSPIEENLVCERGYAIVEFKREELASDNGNAIHGMVASAYPECDWGAIAIWAWGHSRIVDYLLMTDWADTDKIIATGHSRGGKAALCAAIYDERIAVCAPSGSGCGGAGCLRYLGGRYGEGSGVCETVGSINDAAGYWWTDNFGKFGNRQADYTRLNFPVVENDMEFVMKNFSPNKMGKTKDESKLPFDMHFAKALIAPRALITVDGIGDVWSNPYGTQVTWRAAQEVFDFLGVSGNNAMFFHEGGHEYNHLDWVAVADFCDFIFFKKKMDTNVVYCEAPKENPSLMEKILEQTDWRKEKVHFTWERPMWKIKTKDEESM